MLKNELKKKDTIERKGGRKLPVLPPSPLSYHY